MQLQTTNHCMSAVCNSTRESEARRRKVHALKLLLSIISKSVPFWRSSLGSVVLLRRFVVPSLMSCLITDNTAFFRLVLQIYTVLWENFKDQLATELGTHIYYTTLHPVSASVINNATANIQHTYNIQDALNHWCDNLTIEPLLL
jgi:hypothetical protein